MAYIIVDKRTNQVLRKGERVEEYNGKGQIVKQYEIAPPFNPNDEDLVEYKRPLPVDDITDYKLEKNNLVRSPATNTSFPEETDLTKVFKFFSKEINVLRVAAGMPELTISEVRKKIN